jgi:hypothetical protein
LYAFIGAIKNQLKRLVEKRNIIQEKNKISYQKKATIGITG